MNNYQANNSSFSKKIPCWYLSNGRDNLPWRKNITPYRIWISEIMLQQTQVKTVIPFFDKFINKFPSLKSLSIASEDEILALWTGLGFYRRAKNIYKAKEIIKGEFNNKFPEKFEDLIKLPGIGRSTAGAIMSIAYRKPYPILDANVKRVISRYEKIDIGQKGIEKDLWSISESFTPNKSIFEYTQGIMDLGATICSIKSPECEICPINKSCKSAFSLLKETKKTKKVKPKKEIFFTLAHSKNSFLLFRKNENSFWESLWIPFDNDHADKNIIFKKNFSKKLKKIKHALSHVDLDITIEILNYERTFELQSDVEYQWIKRNQIHNYGLPKPIKTIIEEHV